MADRIGLPTVPQLAAIHTRAGVHVATAEFTMTASVAADDLIAICNVPCGARVLPQLSHIISEGVGTLQPVSYTHLDVYKRQVISCR